MQNTTVSNLPNGIKVVSEFIPYVESFSLGFWFNVGTRDENQKNNGISHFIEHMVFKGTKNRSAKKISDDIESFGGYLNAYTTKEHTCFYSKGLKNNFDRTFNVLADLVQNPLFKPNDINKETNVVIDELNDLNDNPEELIFDKFEEVLFDGNSLSFPVLGRLETIKHFSNDNLHKFHLENYGLDNLLIACAGSIEHNDLIKLTEKYFNTNKNSSKSKRNFFGHSKVNELVISKDIQQVHCIIGRNSFGLKDKRRVHLNILSNLLGDGSSSRLFQSIREKLGITYQISSFVNFYYDVSSFGIYFSTNEKNLNKVLKTISKEIKKIKNDGIKQKELSRVKEYTKGNMLLSMESTNNQMTRLANSMLNFNRIISLDEMKKEIDEITIDEINELSKELLDENKFTRIIVSPIP
ncbi:MAG: pitrilysin family protein [Ignavibacterium sp.]